MKQKLLLFTVLFFSVSAIYSQTLYVPNGSTGVGISSNGNVGINTANPQTKLDVNGSVQASTFIKSGGLSSQFLKANGSADSTSYYPSSNPNGYITSSSLNGYVPYTGATQGLDLGYHGLMINNTLAYSPNTDNDIYILRRYSSDYTVFNLWSPPQRSWGKAKEATISLVRGDDNQYFFDLYNMDYGNNDAGNYLDYGNPQMGLRLQKRSTGVYTPFNFEYNDGTNNLKVMQLLPNNSSDAVNNTSVNIINNLTVGKNITVSGKIGIGTSNPDSLLTVNGAIHAKDVVVDLNVPVADYVFSKNYVLMPLHKVEQYVKDNSHLPNIPSAEEVKQKGLNMGEMQNKLLQKVEELTLYVIEQQKKIEAQSAQISEQSAQIGKQNAKIGELEKKMK